MIVERGTDGGWVRKGADSRQSNESDLVNQDVQKTKRELDLMSVFQMTLQGDLL